MVTLNGIEYFSKEDICTRMGVAKATINVKVSKLGIKGVQVGRFKYYTEADIVRMFAVQE